MSGLVASWKDPRYHSFYEVIEVALHALKHLDPQEELAKAADMLNLESAREIAEFITLGMEHLGFGRS